MFVWFYVINTYIELICLQLYIVVELLPPIIYVWTSDHIVSRPYYPLFLFIHPLKNATRWRTLIKTRKTENKKKTLPLKRVSAYISIQWGNQCWMNPTNISPTFRRLHFILVHSIWMSDELKAGIVNALEVQCKDTLGYMQHVLSILRVLVLELTK